MSQPKTTNANDWPDDVAALHTGKFKEVTIEASDGYAVFIEVNASRYQQSDTAAAIQQCAFHPGPYRVGVAEYRVVGDPKCLFTTLRHILRGAVADNIPLMRIGVPPIIAADILGVKPKACYSLRQRHRMANRREKMKAQKGGNLEAENKGGGVIVCTPEVRGEATDEAKEATA